MFRYLLMSPDRVLHDPAVFVSALPYWARAETLLLNNGQLLRILAINAEIDEELIDAGFAGVIVVEPP